MVQCLVQGRLNTKPDDFPTNTSTVTSQGSNGACIGPDLFSLVCNTQEALIDIVLSVANTTVTLDTEEWIT